MTEAAALAPLVQTVDAVPCGQVGEVLAAIHLPANNEVRPARIASPRCLPVIAERSTRIPARSRRIRPDLASRLAKRRLCFYREQGNCRPHLARPLTPRRDAA